MISTFDKNITKISVESQFCLDLGGENNVALLYKHSCTSVRVDDKEAAKNEIKTKRKSKNIFHPMYIFIFHPRERLWYFFLYSYTCIRVYIYINTYVVCIYASNRNTSNRIMLQYSR